MRNLLDISGSANELEICIEFDYQDNQTDMIVDNSFICDILNPVP